MRDSIRRIASAIGIVGLLMFSFVTIKQITDYCSNGQVSCLSAAVIFGVPQADLPMINIETSHAAPTTAHTDSVITMAGFIITVVQVTSVYLILFSVLSLLALEMIELRYLRHLLKVKTRRA